MHAPRISVITATRNAVDLLRENAPDLLQKLGTDDEWVVQDGASNDETVRFLDELDDPRIRLESVPDDGVYGAFNRAIERAHGDYYLFLGADDKLLMALDTIRERLRNPKIIYYGDVQLMSSERRYAGPFTDAKLARTNIAHQGMLYPKAAFLARRYDPTYTIQADWLLNMQCWHDAELTFEYVGCCVALFNDLDGLSSRSVDVRFQRDYPMLLRRYFSWWACGWPWMLHTLAGIYRTVLKRPTPSVRKRPGLRH